MIAVARDERAMWVFAEGDVWIGEIGQDRPRSSAIHDTVSAPMPATVLKLLVAPGDTVRRGETVMVLEAMKMELQIRAGRDGVVKSVACRVGELVQPDVALVEIE
jgi:3-methylcrotonyl-CoA carboxylase alpha subunit